MPTITLLEEAGRNVIASNRYLTLLAVTDNTGKAGFTGLEDTLSRDIRTVTLLGKRFSSDLLGDNCKIFESKS